MEQASTGGRAAGLSPPSALGKIAGVLVRKPLAMVPENLMKYVVGLLLSTFGVFWAVEGIGYFSPAGASLEWPGELVSLGAILVGWIAISRIVIFALRRFDEKLADSMQALEPEAP